MDERLQNSSNPLCSTLLAGAGYSFCATVGTVRDSGAEHSVCAKPDRKRRARHSGVTKIYGAKSNSSATDPAFQSIEVNVSNGVVVLEGPVASKRDRWRAVNSVKVLPDVARIDDRLTISARAIEGATASTYTTSTATFDSTTSKAAEVANEITVAVADDPTLAKSRVNVTVAGDSIELTGTVRTKEQRKRVREIANAFAVHSHVVDKLTIAPSDNGTDSK